MGSRCNVLAACLWRICDVPAVYLPRLWRHRWLADADEIKRRDVHGYPGQYQGLL